MIPGIFGTTHFQTLASPYAVFSINANQTAKGAVKLSFDGFSLHNLSFVCHLCCIGKHILVFK